MTDPILFTQSDHLVAPYMFAKGRIIPEQLAIFRKNTKLDRYAGNSLLRLVHYSWDNYQIRWQEIAGKIPEVMQAITSSPRWRDSVI